MKLMLTYNRHASVIRFLQLVVPLFLDCSRSLSENEQFQPILTTLLTSDRTYIKMARELVSSETAGPVLESQLINYSKYGLYTPTALITHIEGKRVLELTLLNYYTTRTDRHHQRNIQSHCLPSVIFL
jgi:hypothetical protein